MVHKMKKVKIPLFEVYDNPCVSIITGEFTNIIPDGSPGFSNNAYEPVLKVLAKILLKNKYSVAELAYKLWEIRSEAGINTTPDQNWHDAERMLK